MSAASTSLTRSSSLRSMGWTSTSFIVPTGRTTQRSLRRSGGIRSSSSKSAPRLILRPRNWDSFGVASGRATRLIWAVGLGRARHRHSDCDRWNLVVSRLEVRPCT